MKDRGIQISDFSFRVPVILPPKWKPLLHIPINGCGSRKNVPWKQRECKLMLLGLHPSKKQKSEHKYKQSHTKPQKHWQIPMEGDVDFNLRKIYNLFEKHCYKLKMLFPPRNEKSPFAPLQVHQFCNGVDKVWGKWISVSLCLKQQCSQASQIQLFVKQCLVLLPNISITRKGSALSFFKTA